MVLTPTSPSIYQITTATAPGPCSPSHILLANTGLSTESVCLRNIHVLALPPHISLPWRADPVRTVIEAEVRYAVRHEYALTATDVISRRLRLSFLNAQAALDALPRVIDIMAEELNWNAARKREELTCTTRFLQSMGLKPAAIPVPSSSQSWWEWARSKLLLLPANGKVSNASHGRTQFNPGEVDSLREAFVERSKDSAGRLAKQAMREVLQDIPAYASVRTKDFEYVLETGLAGQKDIDMDEFVEVCNHTTSRWLTLKMRKKKIDLRRIERRVVRSCFEGGRQELKTRDPGREERRRRLKPKQQC
jgi:C-terminal domain of alpha-glycerophosphate oxidase